MVLTCNSLLCTSSVHALIAPKRLRYTLLSKRLLAYRLNRWQ